MMKTLISGLVLLVHSFVFSQTNNCTLDLISHSDVPFERIRIFNLSQNFYDELAYEDSVRLNFYAGAPDIYNIWYEYEDVRYRTQIWLDTGEMKVFLSAAQGKHALNVDQVVGAPTYDLIRDFYSGTKGKDKPGNDDLMKLIAQHQDNPASVMIAGNLLIRIQNERNLLQELKALMEQQPEHIKNHILYDNTYDRLVSLLEITSVDLIDYRFLDIEANEVIIPKQKKKLRVLDFWFVHCAPCVADHERIKADVFGDRIPKNVEIIGISRDQDRNLWQEYVKSHELPWKNYKVAFSDESVVKDLKISGFPTYLVLDKKGNILKSFNSYKKVKKYLME